MKVDQATVQALRLTSPAEVKPAAAAPRRRLYLEVLESARGGHCSGSTSTLLPSWSVKEARDDYPDRAPRPNAMRFQSVEKGYEAGRWMTIRLAETIT
jgi:hypothetical protein